MVERSPLYIVKSFILSMKPSLNFYNFLTIKVQADPTF